MNYQWSKSVYPIAALFSFRMLGLFMLLPVFSVYAIQMDGATPTLIGFALGAYGLTQGVLQIPFGMLSDRYGRKPIIFIGLLFFVSGSILGGLTHSIYGMLIARFLQGAGAIGSVLIALLADLTPDEQRTKAMAVIGATIGLSFSLAMIISPPLTRHFGLAGIFFFTVFLAIIGVLLLLFVIPSPRKEPFHPDSEIEPQLFKKVFKNLQLQRLNAGIFCQHFIFTSTFFAIPFLIQHHIQQAHLSQSWQFYLPVLFFSFLTMLPVMILAEKKRQIKATLLTSIVLMGLCQCLLTLTSNVWPGFLMLMFLYFVVFNLLEAMLPSLVSRQASPESKGTAMGVYSSSQFLGIFAGGSIAGVLYQYSGSHGIFMFNTILCILWLLISVSIQPNFYQLTIILHLPKQQDSARIKKKLAGLPGVKHVHVAKKESCIYLKVDQSNYLPGSAEAQIPGNITKSSSQDSEDSV